MSTMTYTGTLTILKCWCGIQFAVPEQLYTSHRGRSGRASIYCPLGHSAVWEAWETTKDRLRAAEARERHLEDQLEATERSRRAVRGHLTRLRNRIVAGVCPWCHRHFSNVQRHVEGEHPDHAERMREALS